MVPSVDHCHLSQHTAQDITLRQDLATQVTKSFLTMRGIWISLLVLVLAAAAEAVSIQYWGKDTHLQQFVGSIQEAEGETGEEELYV